MAKDTITNPDDELLEELDGAEQKEADDTPANEPAPVPVAPADYMVLRMPRAQSYEDGFEDPNTNMDFGPGSKHGPHHAETNIVFRASGGGDGYAIVRKDHPQLDALMRKYPQVEVVESNPRPEAYVCEVCDKEYKTKLGLSNHKRSH